MKNFAKSEELIASDHPRLSRPALNRGGGNAFRSAYNHEREPGLIFADESRTQQEFKEECDINNILIRFQKSGVLPDMIKTDPIYGAFADAPTYQEALNIVIFAQEQFDSLSAEVRDRFDNDPARFLEFASDENNGKELVAMGLATPRVKEMVENAAKAAEVVPETKGTKKGTKNASSDE